MLTNASGSRTCSHRGCWLATLVLCWLVAAVAVATQAGADDGAGRWRWPLDPRPEVVRAFDPPAQQWLAGHRGVDLVGTPRQPVLSAGPGVVGYAGRLAGIGIVVVRHGDLRTTYQPVHATASPGEPVGAGDVIGRLEEFGSHCRPASCLHWGLLRGTTYLDPLTLVQAGPPRLLPLDAAALTSGPVAALPAPARSAPLPPANTPPPERGAGTPGALAVAAALGGVAGSLLVGRHLRTSTTQRSA